MSARGSSAVAHRADTLKLFLRILPASYWQQLRQRQKLPKLNARVYNDAVVIWLMIGQRLQCGSTEAAVLELLRGLPGEFWPKRCKRLRELAHKPLSGNTGSFNEARQQLPGQIVEQGVDWGLEQLLEQSRSPDQRPAFFVDGSSMRMPSSVKLREQYPPGSNQHGESHWPLLRVLVAHDLYTGLAVRPQWGAMNGPKAVSEQGLLEELLPRLPAGCLVAGDANFGVFSVAHRISQSGRLALLRLTLTRARALAGEELTDGIDRSIQWKPSKDDRRNNPDLPLDSCVTGRLIVRRVQPSNGSEPVLLALFTSLPEDAKQVVELYGRRWIIETDLNHLKSALRLEELSSTTPEMVAKEIDVAMLAYNLVRAVICLAAQQTGLEPRQFSFTRVRNICNAFAASIVAAGTPEQSQQLFDRMMYYVRQAKLPRRTRKRPSYPRAVWPKPYKYPKRKSTE
ncbi:MAG: IS4 family transposase [Acetobacteraceae bacterium]|nr:IS4 family transposase [Acetobacteraceae bacterium]